MSAQKLRLKKGDKVVVLTGKDKGKQGQITAVSPKTNKVKVAGVNVAKKHQRAGMNGAGGIIDIEKAIDVSNVAFVDPKTCQPTRIGYKQLEDGKNVRFAKKSGEVIDN